jgi:RNA polymerase sigma-70 factor (family 1)
MVKYSDHSDMELLALLRGGEPAAFNEIFDRYSPVLLTFSYKKLKNLDLAEDMLQSTFADLWEKRASLNVPGDFRPYIFTVLKNRIFDHYKREKVSQRYLDSFQAHIDVENSTDHRIRYNTLASLIEKEIAALPENMRVVFELSRNTSLSRKEIAELLNLPENTIKIRMYRTLKYLKSRLGDAFILIW